MANRQDGKVDLGYVYHLLTHSKIRRDINSYICGIHPQSASAREIAIALNYPERNVIGALIGEGMRYKIEDSLVGMGLLECHEEIVHGYPILLFKATERGLEIEEKLKDYAHIQRSKSVLSKVEYIVDKLEEKIWK